LIKIQRTKQPHMHSVSKRQPRDFLSCSDKSSWRTGKRIHFTGFQNSHVAKNWVV